VLSWQSLDELPGAPGATWLDKQLVARSPQMIASTGLGPEFEGALRSQRQWLLEQGLAREQGGRIAYARHLTGAGTNRGQRAHDAGDRPWLRRDQTGATGSQVLIGAC